MVYWCLSPSPGLTFCVGRQLFERDRNLAISDDGLLEEGTVSVDVSQYEREIRGEDEDGNEDEDEVQVTFSDSD